MSSLFSLGRLSRVARLLALTLPCLVFALPGQAATAAKAGVNSKAIPDFYRLAKAFEKSAPPSRAYSTVDLALAVSRKALLSSPESPPQSGNERPSAPAPFPSARTPISKPGPERPARVGQAVDYGVFASIAVPIGGLPMQPVFKALLPSSRKAAATELAGWKGWAGLMAQVAAIPLREKLAVVNRTINRAIAYRSDARVHGTPDHWASADESLRLGQGDCEDIVIVKLWALAALGMPLDELQLVVLKDRRRGLYHAVLAVHADGISYILDNVTDRLRKDTAIADYHPLYSLANDGGFIHGFRVKDSPRISTTNPFGPIHPGLGAPRGLGPQAEAKGAAPD
jgi:predicted transglutaminase-like cysteine proteinase